MSTAPASATLQFRRLIRGPLFDLPQVRRIAVVQHPQGARFGLFQPGC